MLDVPNTETRRMAMQIHTHIREYDEVGIGRHFVYLFGQQTVIHNTLFNSNHNRNHKNEYINVGGTTYRLVKFITSKM